MKKTISIILLLVIISISGKSQENTEFIIEKANVLTLSTNFMVPLTRFNFLKNDDNSANANGRLMLFNSIGAGLSLNWGKMTESTEVSSKVSDPERKFANAVGIQIGMIFSADISEDGSENTFAPTVSLSVLDFQVGVGYELGTKLDTETGWFMTLSYGIPLQKLTQKGSWVLVKNVPTEKSRILNLN